MAHDPVLASDLIITLQTLLAAYGDRPVYLSHPATGEPWVLYAMQCADYWRKRDSWEGMVAGIGSCFVMQLLPYVEPT